MKLLEDEADFAVADVGEFVFGELRDVLTIKEIFAAGGLIEAADHVHGGRFAGAGWPHDGAVFALVDGHVHVPEGADFGVAGAVEFADLVELNEGRHNQRDEATAEIYIRVLSVAEGGLNRPLSAIIRNEVEES